MATDLGGLLDPADDRCELVRNVAPELLDGSKP